MADPLINDIKSDSEFKRLKAKHVREQKQLESKHKSEMKEMYSRQEAEAKEIELKLLLTKYRELEKRVNPIKQESVIIDTSEEEEEEEEKDGSKDTRKGVVKAVKKGSNNTPPILTLKATRKKSCSLAIETNKNLNTKRRKSITPDSAPRLKKTRITENTASTIKLESKNATLRRSRRLSRLDPHVVPMEHLKDHSSNNNSDEILTYEEYQKLSKSTKVSKKRVRMPRNIFSIDDYTHFIQKWFYGNRDPFVMPLSDLKRRVSDWKSIVEPIEYYKYEKLGLLLEKVFVNIKIDRTLVNTIDHFMKNIKGEDVYLMNRLKTPDTLSDFLNGGERIPDMYKKMLAKGRHEVIFKLLNKYK